MDIITHVYDDFWLWVAIAALEWERHDYANKIAVLRAWRTISGTDSFLPSQSWTLSTTSSTTLPHLMEASVSSTTPPQYIPPTPRVTFLSTWRIFQFWMTRH